MEARNQARTTGLPNDWRLHRLGEICKIRTGKKDVNEGSLSGEFPFFTCSKDIHYSDSYSFDTEAILIAGNGAVGETKYYRGKFEAYQRTYVLDQFSVFGPYLFLFLKGALVSAIARHIAGSTMPYIRKGDLENVEIPIPPPPEQRKIAEVLGVVQRSIEQQERILALTAELKKVLLHKLFTEGLRGEPRKQTEIGPVPESWAQTTLGEIACKPHGFLQTGPFGSQLHKHEYLMEGVGVVNPTHLWDNRINHEEMTRVSPETAARLDRHLLKAGDILFARRGEIGRHGMVTKEEEGWLCGTGCFLARVRQEHIDNRFLSYLFSTRGVIAWLNSRAAGAIMPNLNNTVLHSMPLFFPSKEVQTVIADCLDSNEQKIGIHQRKHAALTDLFRTLLHQVMTAQIRLNDLNMPGLETFAEG